ncbi:MAG TPA: winged helix-turn-helix domain-containing protein [Caulobacteraceae bacterium]
MAADEHYAPQALGDPARLSLLTRLSDGGTHSIGNLSENARLTRQGVTKHLHVLENAGLVTARRVGRERRFVYQQHPVA